MSSWEEMPRRKMWAWAYLTLSIVWLVYNVILFVSNGRWSMLLLPVSFVIFAALLVWRAVRTQSTEDASDDCRKK